MITIYKHLELYTKPNTQITFNIDTITHWICSNIPIDNISDVMYILPPPYSIQVSFNDINVYETIDTIINDYINSSALGFPEPYLFRHLYSTFIQFILINDPLCWISLVEYQIYNIIDINKRIL